MKIHKHLLTHDDVVGATAGKILDLGFNGPFDIKNHNWNMVFVHMTPFASASSDGVTVTAYKYEPAAWAKTTSYTVGTSIVMHKGCIWVASQSATGKEPFDGSDYWRLANPAEIAALTSETGKTSIGTITISQNEAKAGGVFALPMPATVGRYFTLAFTGADAKKVTAGITDFVDTDVTPGLSWKYYKAYTHKVNQPGPIEYAAADMFNGYREGYEGRDPDVED